MDQSPQPSKFNASRDFPQHLAVWCEADEVISKGDACFCAGYSGGVRHMVKATNATSKHLTGDLLFAGYDMPAGRRGNFYPWMILTEQDTSAYAQGAIVYLSTAGDYTDATTAGNALRPVGQVLAVSATAGVVHLEAPRLPVSAIAKTQVLIADLAVSLAAGAPGLLTANNDALSGSTPSTLTVPMDGDYVLIVHGRVTTTLA